ncbi:DNA methyltransferase [Streptomyces phage MeganTheeKilla]|uniref:DNA methyltransferase n=1 Tax=Streptomyces phage MeganTheeKilla TaxID=2801897 RepID=A0A7U0J6I5_9CAUD|nr:DNA methyltransferase [Streptomyces phage MeganTheeKilla]
MRILDLFCGAGGASMGYHQAGFEVVGVDNKVQTRYPFNFVLGDALSVGWRMMMSGRFDFVHASPPCQKYSDLQKRTGKEYPDLIGPVREMLQDSGLPYVIENVDTAPLDGVMLCGSMFDGLRVYRHRLFEPGGWELTAPQHPKHKALVYTYDKRKHHFGRKLTEDMFVQVTGGGNAPIAEKRKAMGIDWMIHKEINESIPPAYTKYVGEQWKSQI